MQGWGCWMTVRMAGPACGRCGVQQMRPVGVGLLYDDVRGGYGMLQLLGAWLGLLDAIMHDGYGMLQVWGSEGVACRGVVVGCQCAWRARHAAGAGCSR